MWYLYTVLVVPALLCSSAFATEPLGSITASGRFELNGIVIPAVAARSIPVASGDELNTSDSVAVILLRDRSRVTINKNSRLQIERAGEELSVRLMQGALQFKVAPRSRLQIFALNYVVTPQSQSEGAVTVEGQNKGEARADQGSVQVEEKRTGKKTWLTRNKAIVLAVAGAGTATAAGIAIASPGPPPTLPPRSPSTP